MMSYGGERHRVDFNIAAMHVRLNVLTAGGSLCKHTLSECVKVCFCRFPSLVQGTSSLPLAHYMQ